MVCGSMRSRSYKTSEIPSIFARRSRIGDRTIKRADTAQSGHGFSRVDRAGGAGGIAPFHRHKLACRRICQDIFSPPAPAGTGILGARVQGFAKSAHPWLSSLRSGANNPNSRGATTALANLRSSFEMYKLQGTAETLAFRLWLMN